MLDDLLELTLASSMSCLSSVTEEATIFFTSTPCNPPAMDGRILVLTDALLLLLTPTASSGCWTKLAFQTRISLSAPPDIKQKYLSYTFLT